MLEMLNPVVVVLSVALVIAVIAAGIFAYKLHNAGVANRDLFGQTALKAGDLADALRDKVVAIVAEESTKLAAQVTLRTQYFDRDDLLSDCGRLPVGFAQSVTLDGKVVRNGDAPAVAFLTQPNGNIGRA